MKLEHASVTKLREQVLAIIGNQLNLKDYQVFFFGSRVSGTNTDRSDIDIGIQGHQPVPENILSSIEEQLEALPLLYKIDVVDFQHTTPEFQQVALQHTEALL